MAKRRIGAGILRAARALECGGPPEHEFAVANLTPLSNQFATRHPQLASRSFCFLDRLDNLVEVRPFACIEFGMEQFAIGANLKGAAARGNQRERFDALAELKNFGRQTDGFRRVVSNNAVFDRYLGLHQQAPFRE